MFRKIARTVAPGFVRRWFQRRKLEHLIRSYPRRVVEHSFGDVSLKVELADPLAAGWYDHDWPQPPELSILGRNQLRSGARVFDIGAHQGVVGLMLGARVGATGQVVLVEPNPHNVSMCIRNVELNAMGWVIVEQAAISDSEGTLRFSGGLNGQAAELSDYGGVFEVAATTIDALTARHGTPNVVFIDVEGFECRALSRAARTFAAHPDWFVEVHVGCGLELAGGCVEQLLEYFPASDFERFVHSEGDREAVSLNDAPAGKLRERFFLTAVSRTKPTGTG